MTGLTHIAAQLNDYGDPRHVEITLDTAFGSHNDDPAAFGNPSQGAVRAAACFVAGVIARVVLAHLEDIEVGRARHGCEGEWSEVEQCPSSCSAKGYDLLGAGEPWASFTVPREEAKQWARRLHAAIAAAAQA